MAASYVRPSAQVNETNILLVARHSMVVQELTHRREKSGVVFAYLIRPAAYCFALISLFYAFDPAPSLSLPGLRHEQLLLCAAFPLYFKILENEDGADDPDKDNKCRQ